MEQMKIWTILIDRMDKFYLVLFSFAFVSLACATNLFPWSVT